MLRIVNCNARRSNAENADAFDQLALTTSSGGGVHFFLCIISHNLLCFLRNAIVLFAGNADEDYEVMMVAHMTDRPFGDARIVLKGHKTRILCCCKPYL